MEQADAQMSIGSDVDDIVKDVHKLNIDVDSNVRYLTPQAAALARMAAQATCGNRDEGWDIRPHPMLEAAGPSREQFDQPGTSPVVVMRNPIAGKQVQTPPTAVLLEHRCSLL